MIIPLPGVFNQVIYPGAVIGPNDVDDCWVVVPFWCLVAAGVCKRAELPTVKAFRAAAGVPDAAGPPTHGGNNLQALAALKTLTPEAKAFSYVSTYADFAAWLAKGAVASVSVRSEHLPEALQFGFHGNHQLGVVLFAGGLRVMNPLDINGAAIKSIGTTAFRVAAEGLFDDGKVHAVIIPDHPTADPRDATIAALTAAVAELRTRATTAEAHLARWATWLAGAPR